MILPGATIGILGSGQLGRMFGLEARRMGYRVVTFSPDSNTPTGQISDEEIAAPYEDLNAIRKFANSVEVITFEFENVPSATVQAAAEIVPVRPNGEALHVTQHRKREKAFLKSKGYPIAEFREVSDLAGLKKATQEIGLPAVLKTAGFGYDGKGQRMINDESLVEGAFKTLGSSELILESFIDFEKELSVVAARGMNGKKADWGVIENRHRQHILDVSLSPAEIDPAIHHQAIEIAYNLLDDLDVIGLLCVEFFLTRQGKLLVNELAPRPHNSGHLTIDASVTNQFEQQLRAVCGLPLGATTLKQPAAMANLLGDLWQAGEPQWARALQVPGIKLHLYGKSPARSGRKMGHLTYLAASRQAALDGAIHARSLLSS